MDNILVCVTILALIISLISIFFSIKIYRSYQLNMKKLGNGKNFAEMINRYVSQVEELNKRDDQIIKFCNSINDELSNCLKNVGLYKYNAFGNTKNELSFSLALLSRKNDGIVINSIYGQDSSNIYAKPILNGKCKYKLSEEEEMAINIAMNQGKKKKISKEEA